MNLRLRKQIDSIYRQAHFDLELALTNIFGLCANNGECLREIIHFLKRHNFQPIPWEGEK